jgi:hypothetical protein
MSTTFNYADFKISHEMVATKFVETEHATVAAEDWSRVRSPSRTLRRMKRGFHNRNIRHYRKPTSYKMGGVIYIHPTLARAVREQVKNTADDMMTKAFFGWGAQ